MKKRCIPFLISGIFAYAALSADATTLGYTAFLQQMTLDNAPPCARNFPDPFGVTMQGFAVGKSKMKDGAPGKISYAEGEVDAVFTQKFTEYEGMSYVVGVDQVFLDWNDNPFFQKKHYHSLDLGFLGYTTRAKGWLWQVGMGLQYSLDFGHLGRYTRYSALIWGRYCYSSTIGLHAGFYGFYNLRKDKVYPIVGFDWHPWKNWQFNVIFPMNVSANYLINPRWSVGLAWRPIWSRHRVGNNEVDSKGIWENRDNGVELGLNYCSPQIEGGIYVGYSVGGTLKIMDKNGNNPSYFKYDPAPYAGLRVWGNF